MAPEKLLFIIKQLHHNQFHVCWNTQETLSEDKWQKKEASWLSTGSLILSFAQFVINQHTPTVSQNLYSVFPVKKKKKFWGFPPPKKKKVLTNDLIKLCSLAKQRSTHKHMTYLSTSYFEINICNSGLLADQVTYNKR